MHCPKCDRENPDDAKMCSSCGFVLTCSSADESEMKAKTSKIAIVGLILLVLTSIISLISATLHSTQIVILMAVLPVIFGIKSLIEIRKSKGRLKGKVIAIFQIVVPICLAPVCILWSMDAAPIPNDYTIDDLHSAPPAYNHSFSLLKNLWEKDLPDGYLIGLSGEDVNTIETLTKVIAKQDYANITKELKTSSENIYTAWANGQKGRDIISELNTFSQIADLTEITALTDPEDITYGFAGNLKHLVYLYQAYIYLKIENGDEKAAINELIILDSVFRKLSINARSPVTKLVCIAALGLNIRTANFIANSPHISDESLVLLAKHFKLLEKVHTSLRNPLLFEYLTVKKSIDAMFNEYMYKRPSMLKRNSAIRLFRNYCDEWIVVTEGSRMTERKVLSVWPIVCPNWLHVTLDSEGNVPRIYKYYNPVGSMMVMILIPAIEKIFQLQTKLEIHDDLLQIVLNKRLGNPVNLKARAYSDKYLIDGKKKKIFSPGPDRKNHTKDDIKLLINPEVLNFAIQRI